MKAHLPQLTLCAVFLVACDDSELLTEASQDVAGEELHAEQSLTAKTASSGYRAILLGKLPGFTQSAASDINDSFVIVGHSLNTGGTARATRWTVSSSGTVLSITDLGQLGGSSSVANAVNNSGVVVGRGYTTSGAMRAFVWTQSAGMRALSVPGLSCSSEAFDINDVGEIVGNVSCSGTSGIYRWTVNSSGVESAPPTDFGTLNGTASMVFAINRDGKFVGSGNSGGYVASRAGVVTIIPGTAEALDLNDAGKVVGWTSGFIAFSWTPAQGLTVLGTLGGSDSVAFDVNEAGEIVGESRPSRGWRQPFHWANGAMKQLPMPSRQHSNGGAFGINESSAIAGQARSSRGSEAVLWVR